MTTIESIYKPPVANKAPHSITTINFNANAANGSGPCNPAAAAPSNSSHGNHPTKAAKRTIVRVTSRKFVVETGHKLPNNLHRPGSLQHQIFEILENLPVATHSSEDKSFLIQTHADWTYVYRIAKEMKIRIKTQKQNGTGIRVWRIK